MEKIYVLKMENIVLGILLLCHSAYSWSFVYYKQTLTWDEVKSFCQSQGMVPGIVSTQQRWNQVVANITTNGRYFATDDMYIGLEYNDQLGEYWWVDGLALDWSLWFTNEPYNVDTRRCARLAADVQLHFRTTDCSYSHYFLCSKDDVITTTTVSSVITQEAKDDSSQIEMIVGLSVGFAIFIFILAMCCLMCYCCTSSESKYKQNTLLPVPRGHSKGRYTRSDDADYRVSSGHSVRSTGSYDESNFVHIEPILDKVYYKRRHDYDDISLNDSSTSSRDKIKHRDVTQYI